jgi:hypothetical protein
MPPDDIDRGKARDRIFSMSDFDLVLAGRIA